MLNGRISVLLIALCTFIPYDGYAQIKDTVRASVGSSNQQSTSESSCPQISRDGRYVAFANSDTSLVPGGVSGAIYVRDLVAGTTVRADSNAQGTGGDRGANFGGCDFKLSANGEFVAFVSDATNLVSGTTSGTQVYRKNLSTGEIIRVSESQFNVPAVGNCSEPSISDDGRYVLFSSDASDLVSGDTNSSKDVFVYDADLDQMSRVSLGNSGLEGNGISGGGDISGDGRYVLFSTSASNLVTGGGFSGLLLRDLQEGTTKQLNIGTSLALAYDLSSDGQRITFLSSDSTLVSGDTNNTSDVFVYNASTDEITRISVDSAGKEANGLNYLGQTAVRGLTTISDDNRFVTFGSIATNLVTADINGNFDVFVRDVSEGKTLVTSIRPRCIPATDPQGETSEGSAISGDGRFVVFLSRSTDLVDGDTNNVRDVFVAELIGPDTVTRGSKPSSPNTTTCSKNASVSAPIFLTDAEGADSLGIRAAQIRNVFYEISVKRSGVAKEVAKKTSKRNAIALRSLRSGTYKATYRLLEKKGREFKPLTKSSRPKSFVIP